MKAMHTIKIGSRGSQLALWQAHWIKAELERRVKGLQIEVVTIKTTGDKILDSPLSRIGDKGLFTKEIEHALVARGVDMAVHSLKDLPTELPRGLAIGAITRREDVRDVFISHPKKNHRRFEDLPHGARIATGSLRRRCQLLNWRPDLEIVDIRGNLNTRFEKLDSSDWDGLILAKAGIDRLGRQDRITEVLPVERLLPAVGQGALAIEIREDDDRVQDTVRAVAHEPTSRATLGERALLRLLEGGCQVPIGTYGRLEGAEFRLDAMIGSLDGRTIVRGKIHGTPEQSEDCGVQLARTLLDCGGGKILETIRRKGQPEMQPADI